MSETIRKYQMIPLIRGSICLKIQTIINVSEKAGNIKKKLNLNGRARPKSANLRIPFLFIKIFAAFMSLCRILFLWMTYSPSNSCCITFFFSPIEKFIYERVKMIFGWSRVNLFVREQSRKIVLAEFKDEMNFGSFFRSVVRFCSADFDQLDDVFILELLQDLDFSQSSYRKAFALVFHQHLFQRHYSTCYCTFGFPNFTECTLEW